MTKPSLRKKANRASRLRSRSLVCVLEYPQLMANIMGIVRTSEALGIGKVCIINKGRVKLPKDWKIMREEPRLIKMSASGIKWLYVQMFSSTQECLDYLAKKNFAHVGTSPHQIGKKNVVLPKGRYTYPHLAVWLGNESKGLSQEALDACKFCIQIPMSGIIESMNLSSSAAITLFQVVEKRKEYTRRKLARRTKRKHSKS